MFNCISINQRSDCAHVTKMSRPPQFAIQIVATINYHTVNAFEHCISIIFVF